MLIGEAYTQIALRGVNQYIADLKKVEGATERSIQKQISQAEKIGQNILASKKAMNQQRLGEEQKLNQQVLSAQKLFNQQRLREEQRTEKQILAFKKAMNQQRLREEQGGKEKGEVGFLTASKNILKAAPAFAVATAAIAAAYGALRGLKDEFVAGLSAVEDYKLGVVKMAAIITSFSDKTAKGDLGGAYKDALAYSKELVVQLEILDAKTIATGRDLMTMAETFAQHGVLLDLNNKKAVSGFLNIANALKILTAGQNQDIQMRQEINALMMGTIRHTDRLGKFLSRQVKDLKEQVHQWRLSGKTFEKMEELLSGFGIAGKDIERTWAAIGTSLSTIHTRILRAGFLPAYNDLLDLAESLKLKFVDQNGQLTEMSEIIIKDIRGAWSRIKSLIEGTGLVLVPIVRDFGKLASQMREILGLKDVSIPELGIVGYMLFGKSSMVKMVLGLSVLLDYVGRISNAAEALSNKEIGAFDFIFLSRKESIELQRLRKEAMAAGPGTEEDTKYKLFIANMQNAKEKAAELKKQLDTLGVTAPKTGLASLFGEINDVIEKIEKDSTKITSSLAAAREKMLRGTVSGEATIIREKWDKLKAVELESKRDLEMKLELLEVQSNGSKSKAIEAARKNLLDALRDSNSRIINIERAASREKEDIYKDFVEKAKKGFEEISIPGDEADKITEKFDKMRAKVKEYADALILAWKVTPEALEEIQKKYKAIDEAQEKAIDETRIKAVDKELKDFFEGLDKKAKKPFETIDKGLEDFFGDIDKAAKNIDFEHLLNWVDGAREGLHQYQKSAGTVFEGVSGIVSKAFKGMEDALVEFVTTGKFSFTGMVDSMIADIARLVIQQQITQPLAQMLMGSSAAGGLGSAAGNIARMINPGGTDDMAGYDLTGGGGFWSSLLSGAADLFSANGNAFSNSGVIPFVNGGAFTNSIVSKPTQFSFANGGMFGEMGEKGPEAIMPLQRDSSGKLGVVAAGGAQGQTVINVNVASGTPDNVRRAAGQGAREALGIMSASQRYV